MAVPTKRSWKLQEFVAHSANVNCLAFGHKSGRVIATGGEDKKVNMWALGKPNCIMSLSGHTSPVEAVRFGNAEELVVAGSMSGALKIWDLEAAKIVRTLTGHKSNIRSLDFHPYGDFVASGSLDTNVKLWDIRRKGCIFTYKGHTNCVNHLRFSPDGRWIVSAGEDGLIKLWDLTAGKLLTELKDHTGPVNSVEFHPNEFLLASGSSDRTIKFWDLETMQCVSTTDGESGAMRNILYHPEGTCIFGGSHDVLKVYGWEPSACFDSAAVGWNRVADMAIAQTQLYGASFSQSSVSVYVVDLQKMQTMAGQAPSEPVGYPPSEPVNLPKQTPAPLTASGRKTFSSERPQTQSSKQAPKEEIQAEEPPATEDPGDDAQSTADVKDPQEYRDLFQPKSRLASPPMKAEPFPAPPEDEPAPAPQLKNATSVVPSNRAAPGAVTASDFLPKQPEPAVGNRNTRRNMSESEALSAITNGHNSMKSVLNNRIHNLQVVRALWTGGNVKTAIETALGMNDQSVLVDLLNIMILKPNMWSLDITSVIIPALNTLLTSKYENYVQVSCNSLKLVLKNFGPVIKTNIAAPPGIGVDISREERYRKCKLIYNNLMEVRSVLDSKQNISGKLGSTFRELQLLLGTLD